MTPRDARLLPRLIEVMNTAENERELGMAVLQLRRILATDGREISDLLEEKKPAEYVPLIDDRHEVFTRLRDLGRMLEFARHTDPEAQRVLQTVSVTLSSGGGEISFADMRLLLAAMRDLLKARAPNVVQHPHPSSPPTTNSNSLYDIESMSVASLNEMMKTWRDAGTPFGFTPRSVRRPFRRDGG